MGCCRGIWRRRGRRRSSRHCGEAWRALLQRFRVAIEFWGSSGASLRSDGRGGGVVLDGIGEPLMGRGYSMPSVSVVIPTLNGGRLFAEVMDGLCRQKFVGAVEILVIDSGSTDGTVGVALAAGARVAEIPQAEFDHGLTRK